MKARPDIKRGQVKEWPKIEGYLSHWHPISRYLMRGYVTGKLWSFDPSEAPAREFEALRKANEAITKEERALVYHATRELRHRTGWSFPDAFTSSR